jgi:lysozyme
MINAAGRALLTELEGIRLTAYKCKAGVWTIGRGHTDGVKEGDTITKEQEQALFEQDMAIWSGKVRRCLHRKPTPNQLSAFVVFAFNIGLPGFIGSTALRAYEAYDDAAVIRAMGLWHKITVIDKATGKKVKVDEPVLVARRAREGALFMTPEHDYPGTPPMPQEVIPEKPMTQSTITQASVVAGATTVSAIVTAITDMVDKTKESFSTLGDFAVPMMLGVTLCAVGYIAWERFNLRRQGRA